MTKTTPKGMFIKGLIEGIIVVPVCLFLTIMPSELIPLAHRDTILTILFIVLTVIGFYILITWHKKEKMFIFGLLSGLILTILISWLLIKDLKLKTKSVGYDTAVITKPEIDKGKWGKKYVKEYIFPHIEINDIYNYHSYVKNPPYMRRAIRDMLLTFEISKDRLNSLLDTTPRYKYSEQYEIEERLHIPKYLIEDVTRKIHHINERAEEQPISFYGFTKEIRLFKKKYKSPESPDGYIIIDEAKENKDRYIVIYTQSDEYNNPIQK